MGKLTVIGCGDAFGSGGRMQSCYHIESGGRAFMLDCGATYGVAVKRLPSPPQFDTIFISHLHGDHFGGLPFLLIDWLYISRREAPVTIVGPPGVESRVWTLCDTMYPGVSAQARQFKLTFVELRAGAQSVAGYDVQAFEVNHFSGAPSYALRFTLNGKVFAFTGDAGWSDALIEAGRGASLYLMECYQYDLRLNMHLDYLMIDSQFERIGARKTLLTHMHEAMLARSGDVDAARYILANDGITVEF
jgi:ribonuclease BN (tRNA processing enzyme)